MQDLKNLAQSTKQFAVDSERFLNRCEKPDRKEFLKIAASCAIGFGVMGAIGYVIKLLFIPINNIILS